jgi:hypothetical protein
VSLFLTEEAVDDQLHEGSDDKQKNADTSNNEFPERRYFQNVGSLVFSHVLQKVVFFDLHFGIESSKNES